MRYTHGQMIWIANPVTRLRVVLVVVGLVGFAPISCLTWYDEKYVYMYHLRALSRRDTASGAIFAVVANNCVEHIHRSATG